MSGGRLGIKSAKGTGTSGFITKSNVIVRNRKKTHRYLHESDMEDSDEENEGKPITSINSKDKNNEKVNNIGDILALKKEQLKRNTKQQSNLVSKTVHRYVNKLQDYIEDNYIELGEEKQLVLDKYRMKLISYFDEASKPQENAIPLKHDLLDYKKQLRLLAENQNALKHLANKRNSINFGYGKRKGSYAEGKSQLDY